MQVNIHKLKSHALTGAGAAIWVSGLLVAGSDSHFMPWLNLAGLGLFIAGSAMVARGACRLENVSALPGRPKFSENMHPKPELSMRSPERKRITCIAGVLIKY